MINWKMFFVLDAEMETFIPIFEGSIARRYFPHRNNIYTVFILAVWPAKYLYEYRLSATTAVNGMWNSVIRFFQFRSSNKELKVYIFFKIA